ncbi:Cysteine dioxygenase [Fusarium oxysporum f. sp. albedinis]|nr:Cysteine dioxygenase [Fusarium oxysporum f. sp. albedinis]
MSRRNVDSFSTRLTLHLLSLLCSRLGLAGFEIVQGREIARMWRMRLKVPAETLGSPGKSWVAKVPWAWPKLFWRAVRSQNRRGLVIHSSCVPKLVVLEITLVDPSSRWCSRLKRRPMSEFMRHLP